MIWLNILLIIVSVLLIVGILVQSRSAGVSAAFGGGAEGMYVRRGGEKRIFQITTALAALFLVLAFAHLLL